MCIRDRLLPVKDFLDSLSLIPGEKAFIENKDVPAFCQELLPEMCIRDRDNSIPVVEYKKSSRRRHTRSSNVTGVQTCALPISEVRSLMVLPFFSLQSEQFLLLSRQRVLMMCSI